METCLRSSSSSPVGVAREPGSRSRTAFIPLPRPLSPCGQRPTRGGLIHGTYGRSRPLERGGLPAPRTSGSRPGGSPYNACVYGVRPHSARTTGPRLSGRPVHTAPVRYNNFRAHRSLHLTHDLSTTAPLLFKSRRPHWRPSGRRAACTLSYQPLSARGHGPLLQAGRTTTRGS